MRNSASRPRKQKKITKVLLKQIHAPMRTSNEQMCLDRYGNPCPDQNEEDIDGCDASDFESDDDDADEEEIDVEEEDNNEIDDESDDSEIDYDEDDSEIDDV
jgi:hypothetical protein